MGVSAVTGVQGKAPKGLGDFRKALEDKDVDALVIAAPDHWHTPAALLAMQAGKQRYGEETCGDNPRGREPPGEAQRQQPRGLPVGARPNTPPPSIEIIPASQEKPVPP